MIDSQILKEIYKHAVEVYPEECCGLIQATTSRRCENIASKLHRSDPKRYPRSARGSYAFSAKDIRFLIDSLETSNPATTIYHSHPDVGAYFSSEDLAFALFDGSPAYPVSYLVIDVRANGIEGAKQYTYDGDTYALAAEYTKDGEGLNSCQTSAPQ